MRISSIYSNICGRSQSNHHLKQDKIQECPVILLIVSKVNEHNISQRRFTTCSKVAKTSFLKPILRISFHICSIGFISGVHGGKFINMAITLRRYQNRLIDDIAYEFKQGKTRVCAVAPCGAGKTVMTGWMARAASLNNKRVLFMVHRQELIYQTSRTFSDLGVRHGKI